MSENVQTNERPKVTALTQISYGLCEMGSTMCASIGTQYFAFFITDILMMSAAVMTPILLIGRIGDFVTILISSIVVEKVNMRWGKYRSFLLVCAPLAYIFFLSQYARYAGDNNQANMIIGVICYVLSFGIFNFGRTATMALLNVLGRDQKEKAMLSARKGQFASITPLIFGATFLPLALIFSGAAKTGSKTDLTGKGFFLATVVFYTIYLVCNMIFFRATKPYDLPGENNGQGQKKAKLSAKEMVEQILGNKALIFLLLAQTINGAANNVITSGVIYYFKVVAQDLSLQPIYSTVSSLVGIAGALILGELNDKIGKRNLAIFGSVLGMATLLFIRFFCFGKTVWLFIIVMGLNRFGAQAIQVCGVGMFGDCVEYGKYKLGKEARGFIMGLFMIPIKLGVVLGAPILSKGLAAVNYDAKMAITEEVQMGVFNTITLIPACVMLLSLIFYILYPLSNKKMEEVLAANKAASEAK